jgi:DNA-binding XRE family transcriptional regulator
MQVMIDAYFKECDPHWIDDEYYKYPKDEDTGKLDYSAEPALRTKKRKTEQQPYTMAGLAHRLGLSRQALMEYKKDRGDKFGDTIKAARAIVEEFNERLLLSGKYATGAIFNLKVNFGYKENDEENKPPENPIIFVNNVPTDDTPVSRPRQTVPPDDED